MVQMFKYILRYKVNADAMLFINTKDATRSHVKLTKTRPSPIVTSMYIYKPDPNPIPSAGRRQKPR